MGLQDMGLQDMGLQDLPLWLNSLVFCGAAAVVWIAGIRLAGHAETITDITGLGAAFIGVLLLGGITSLPEIAVSTTASLAGSAPLAVNNILGGVALQVVIIAVGDAALRNRPLSSEGAGPTVTVQALLLAVLLGVVASAVLVGEVAVLGVGLWSSFIFVTSIAMLWRMSREEEGASSSAKATEEGPSQHRQLLRAMALTAVLAGVITAGGFAVARTSEALAEQTGLGQSFVGAIFTSVSTSLPEVSTVLGAVSLGRYTMAFSDIFGTNIFDVALLFLIDMAYGGPPILNEVGAFSVFVALLGMALSLIYAVGLWRRPRHAVFHLGLDSLLVIATYLLGLGVMYGLR